MHSQGFVKYNPATLLDSQIINIPFIPSPSNNSTRSIPLPPKHIGILMSDLTPTPPQNNQPPTPERQPNTPQTSNQRSPHPPSPRQSRMREMTAFVKTEVVHPLQQLIRESTKTILADQRKQKKEITDLRRQLEIDGHQVQRIAEQRQEIIKLQSTQIKEMESIIHQLKSTKDRMKQEENQPSISIENPEPGAPPIPLRSNLDFLVEVINKPNGDTIVYRNGLLNGVFRKPICKPWKADRPKKE